MKKLFRVSLFLFFCMMFVSSAFADVPKILSFQGRITDNSGVPITTDNAFFKFTFHTQASGGSQVGTDILLDNKRVDNGIYTVNIDIGGQSAILAALNQQLYIEVGFKEKSTDDYEIFGRTPLTSSLYAMSVANGSITPEKMSLGGETFNIFVASASYAAYSNPTSIPPGSIDTAKLKDKNVTTEKLADNAVTTIKITDKNVTTEKLADNAVTTIKITDKNVTTEKLADNAVTTIKITDKNVTTEKLADNAVTTIKITDKNVTTDKLDDNAVTTGKIKDKAITSGKLVDSSAGTPFSIYASNAVNSGTSTWSTNSGTSTWSTKAGTSTWSTNSGTSTWSTKAGTSTWSTNSGTSTWSTKAGTSTWSTNSGTSTWSMNSGTSTWSTNSGTSTWVTNSGTSTWSTNSGTSTWSTNSGTSTWSTNSGTSTWSTNSGTSTWATNAGTSTWSANAGFADVANSLSGPVSSATWATNSGTSTWATESATSTFAQRAASAYDDVFSIGTSSISWDNVNLRIKVEGNLHVAGQIYSTNTVIIEPADLAEIYPSNDILNPGDVVVISDTRDGYIEKSKTANDTKVAGVISTEPGILLNASEKGYKLALVGKVPVNVTNEGGDIKRGDLLVASSTPGYAMKAVDPKPGTIIGKALENYMGSRGKILALVNIQ